MIQNKWIWLSHFSSESTPGFGGEPSFKRERTRQIQKGDSSNSEVWSFSNHCGTHIDLPKHFSDDGNTLSEMTLTSFVFLRPQLIEWNAVDAQLLTPADVKSLERETDLLLIRTGFEARREDPSYWKSGPGVSAEVGTYLRQEFPKLRAIGFDFLSLTSFQHREEGRRAHRAFLAPEGSGHPILIIEDMSLKNLNTSLKSVLVSPLLVAQADGSPVTVWGERE